MQEQNHTPGMHIILTHEQADFDALGSLLGAYLLYDTAIPLLPRRMNRNVRAFLSLYGADLPFTEQRDLPSEPVTQVTLVDTQSMITLKGMSAKAKVTVIDHHPRRENLPVDWAVITGEVGATTTLLVEDLRDHDGRLSTVQATLLLLGVYEDTGSLTYKRTSPRDLQAAAFLLEQGASLEVAGSFLNHPLSAAQEELYNRLRLNSEHFHIQGYTIVVSCGDAREMDEELSSLAHKLRDFLEPDALFLLVTTHSGIQMIARSTTDNIDVAEIVGHFGGGGHERAAASLIRERNLEEVKSELNRILPEHVIPSISVAQIMSRGPQLVAPETTVEQAALRMSRFGHEGYPVVKNGKVIGLLTRRAVDRAISHRLHTTAASLMEAGDYTVSPEDSIEFVQRLVAETGWGQIPVMNPENGEIIGIVTRTDLLKTLTSQDKIPGRLNFSERLEKALPEDRLSLIKKVAQAAYDQKDALYIVGGFVRDLILERPSLDFDLVVEGDAIALARILARRFGGRVTSHSRFGTAKWHLQPIPPEKSMPQAAISLKSVDLVSARTEFYTHPTALPTVERGSIKLDLHRRDFTINTLALRLDGRHYGDLHDYWGGLEDIRQGTVRVLHSLSFVDDPTRILRAVRFEQRFSFHIEERTLQLLMEAKPLIEKLSGDRIRHELNSILSEEGTNNTLSRLDELGLMKAIHPELVWDGWLRKKLSSLENENTALGWEIFNGYTGRRTVDLVYFLWLIRLTPVIAQKIINRLKFPLKLAREIRSACQLWLDREQIAISKPSQIYERLDDVASISIYALYLASDDPGLNKLLLRYAEKWRHINPSIDGSELRKRGVPPGPIYRDLLRNLRAAWLDEVVVSRAEEEALLNDLLESYDKGRS